MNDEPFSHRAGIDVPEDVRRSVRHVVAGGSESEGVVEADNFHQYQNLEWLELREGTLKIGRQAFLRCRHLRRVDSPSSLRWIGCGAFGRCSSLFETNLPEGLRSIGHGAFHSHCSRHITIPSSVREIGIEAFSNGSFLSKVTLAGGTVLVGRLAFYECRQLQSIATPSVVIVVEEGEYGGNSRAEVVTGGTITYRELEPTRLILSSPYLASMQYDDDDTKVIDATRVSDVTRVKNAINRIASGQPQGEGPLDLAAWNDDDWIRVREGADRIRSRFLGLLSAHRGAIASILGRVPLWESEGGGVEPGVVEIILSYLGDVEG